MQISQGQYSDCEETAKYVPVVLAKLDRSDFYKNSNWE